MARETRGRWTPAYDRLFDPEHELAGDQACRRWAWLDLCHQAQYEDGHRVVNGTLVDLKRGELVASYRYLSERWNWSIKRARTFLTLLDKVGKIGTVRETAAGTVYRIVTYDTWANPGHSKGHSSGHEGGTAGAQQRPQRTTDTAGTNRTTTTPPTPPSPEQRGVGLTTQVDDSSRNVTTRVAETSGELDTDPPQLRQALIDVCLLGQEEARSPSGKSFGLGLVLTQARWIINDRGKTLDELLAVLSVLRETARATERPLAEDEPCSLSILVYRTRNPETGEYGPPEDWSFYSACLATWHRQHVQAPHTPPVAVRTPPPPGPSVEERKAAAKRQLQLMKDD